MGRCHNQSYESFMNGASTMDLTITDSKNIRPPMTPTVQAAVVKDLSRRVSVIWPIVKKIDELFPESTDPTPEGDFGARSVEVIQLQRRAKLEAPLGDQLKIGESTRHRFWELQSKINSVSAVSPSYAAARAYFDEFWVDSAAS